MFALNAPIKARLQSLPALAGWTVRTSTDLEDRDTPHRAVDVRVPGGGVAGVRSGAVMVQPGWSLVLAVRRSATAADELEAAFAAVIEALHGWAPGLHAGRGWEPLQLAAVADAVFADAGLAGVELTFSTQALYRGQE
ncbi:hypothetical protein [Acidovorax temperans]|uniref:phage tail terminator protein n=1 Tax=Acidovorax temperans TaxID=80878 RepID=UPI002898CA2E|nr:hypothetical protein [Acidovorax temperans]